MDVIKFYTGMQNGLRKDRDLTYELIHTLELKLHHFDVSL